MKLTDDVEASDGLTAEDKDLLKSLETMAAEIDSGTEDFNSGK